MGSIINRDGRWRAQVRRVGHRAQCKTFESKAEAERWVRRLESDIDQGKGGGQFGELTIGDVIDAYEKLRGPSRPISDSSNEHYMLKALKAGLGPLRLAMAKPSDIVGYASSRRDAGAGPYTINMDISKLGTVLRYGSAALGIAPPDLVGAARPMLSHLRLIGGGGKRERRPTDDEMTRLLEHLESKHGRAYADVVVFAATSAMRRGEVCALQWSNIDEATKCANVLRKHPRKGKVLERVPLLPAAWAIVSAQPKTEDPRVFPIHPQTISKYFTEACKDLSIPDLHLHDMRHEGTSRLFEEGYGIEQVALVTGHKSWANLKRYTNLRPEDLTRQAHAPDQGKRPRRGGRRTASSRPRKSEPGTSQG